MLEHDIYNKYFDRWFNKGTYELMLQYDRDWHIKYNINHILLEKCRDHIDKWIGVVNIEDKEFELIRKGFTRDFTRDKSIITGTTSGVIL